MSDQDRVAAVGVLARLFIGRWSREEIEQKVQFLKPEEVAEIAAVGQQLELLRLEVCEVLDRIGDRQLQDLATAEM